MNRWRAVYGALALTAAVFATACQGRPGGDPRAAADEHSLSPTSGGGRAPAGNPTVMSSTAGETNPTPPPSAPGTEALTGASSVAEPAPVVAEVEPVPPLRDANGQPLAQTDDKPTASSPSLQRRLTLLVQAIAEDKPELALPCFFPVEAYAQVKAIEKPERDWQRRLVAAFTRNIHEYHRQLGVVANQVKLQRLEVPEVKVKWMKPGSEGNRVGYYRVVRSKLVVSKPDGSETALELTSLISWRGEWYVVHLHGFE